MSGKKKTHYQVFAVPDGPQALNLVKNIKPELLILDYWLPTTNGIELNNLLHDVEGLERVPTIMLSVRAPLREINQRQIMYMRKLLEAIDTL